MTEAIDPVAERAQRVGQLLRHRSVLTLVVTLLAMFVAGTFTLSLPVLVALGGFALFVQYWLLLRPVEKQLAHFLKVLTGSNREMAANLKSSEETLQSRSRLLAGMSHEIRTPLNGIVGFSDFLISSQLDRQQQEYAHTIQLCSKHLLTILDGLMDFSRLELAKLKLNVQPCNAMEVLEEAIQMVAPIAYGKQLELWNLADPELDRGFILDPDRLRQVLVNLITNGVKFTARGHVQVEGRVGRDGQGRPTLEFVVSDTGPGIPVDVQGIIFEPFRQMDVSVSRRYGGSGLGLAICKGLVELMDGEIRCHSELNKGACFQFSILAEPASGVGERRLQTGAVHLLNCPPQLQPGFQRWCAYWNVRQDSGGIPITFSESPPDEGIWACPIAAGPTGSQATRFPKPYRWTHLRDLLNHVQVAPPAAPPTASMNGLEILVVEDNSINRKVLCTLLERLGATVDSAENGQRALDILEKKTYPVIFMDLAMPVVDGFDATRMIRERYRDPAYPWIIACTAQATAEDRDKAFQVGMNDFISKPIQKEKLLGALSQRPATPPALT